MDINSSDHSKLVTGGNDKNATVFNKDTEQVVAILKGHTKKVTKVIYHSEEDTVITASPDTSIRIWHVPTYVRLNHFLKTLKLKSFLTDPKLNFY